MIIRSRRLLDNIATRIVKLDRGILHSYPSSFSKYNEREAQELTAEAEHNRLFNKFYVQKGAWIRRDIRTRRARNEGHMRRLEGLHRQRAGCRNVQG